MKEKTFENQQDFILYFRAFKKQAQLIFEELEKRHPEFVHYPDLCLDYIEDLFYEEIEDRLTDEEFRKWIYEGIVVINKKVIQLKKKQPEILENITEAIIQDFESDAEYRSNPNLEEY